MQILSIDVGSYSVKYVNSVIDRRKTHHNEMSEVILRDYLDDHPGMSLDEAKLEIVQEIMQAQAIPDGKVIFQINNSMVTTRFLTLPVKSKKKAELMLPFQLEEDIPYALSEIHYSYRMESQKSQHVALAELVKLSNFESFFQKLREKSILPQILTTESSVVENFYNQNAIAGPFCVLDIGHTTTKAYFFYNSRLLASHICYLGGAQVSEMIAKNYGIEIDEAIIYKHQNAFFLTSAQHSGVEASQSEFAQAMDKVFSTLIADFARWKIGFKVNFGLSVPNVFLIGGTSNIKNITNYLTEKFDSKVALLETFDKVSTEKIDVNPKNKSKFALVNMMAQGFRRKNRFINFLTGRFAQAGAAEVPLHALAFIGVRITAATLIIALTLLAERFFINRDIQAVNAKLNSVIKNEELAIPGRLKRSLVTTPKPVYDQLLKKGRGIRQEISTIQAAVETEALSPLILISQIAGPSDATMIEFFSNDLGEIKAAFIAQELNDLKKLKSMLEQSQLQDVVVELDESKVQLNLKAMGK